MTGSTATKADARRRTIRTMFQALLAGCALAPVIAQEFNLPLTGGIVGGIIVGAGIVSRVMAIPAVDDFLARFVPWLTKDPAPELPAPPAVPPAVA